MNKMDTLQKTFKESYVRQLKSELQTGESLNKYSMDAFEYDASKVRNVAGVYHEPNLLDQMMAAKNDFDAGVALYEAFSSLPAVVAASEPFWAYLTHVDLFPYVKKRWGNTLGKPDDMIIYWFFGKGYIRNALASLWWSVDCSKTDNQDNPFELTRILFLNATFRTRVLRIMLRTRNGLRGILEFLRDNSDVTDKAFEMRGRYIAKHFNAMGAVKQLSYLDSQFFYNQCELLKPKIMDIIDNKSFKLVSGYETEESEEDYS